MINKRYLIIAGIGIVVWGGFSIAAYFVSHKPYVIQLIAPLVNLLWSLTVTGVLSFNAFLLGRIALNKLVPGDTVGTCRLILSGGLGLGGLGLLGFGLALIGATSPLILAIVQALLLIILVWGGASRHALAEAQSLMGEFHASALTIPTWMRWAAALALLLTFLKTLLPPIEAFDAMLYHLTIPALWIRDSGLRAYDFPHYWFPALVEGVFVWGLGLGSEIVPQQIHLLWAVLVALLVWHWTRELWGDLTAWLGLMILISMPSVLLLASWAYTDLALTFYGLATLYCLWSGIEHDNTRWWNVSAVFAGLAMGIKYTSFVIPVSAVLLIALWRYRQTGGVLKDIARFSTISAATGSIWYLRNWLWMGNPFYPFAFGGRYWDSFRAAAFSGAGTGIGRDWRAILSLPLTITLGYQDVNYFDGNIGPLFLVCLPLILVFLTQIRSQSEPQKRAVGIILLYAIVSTAFWVYSYMTTRNLWQTRLLFPALITSIILAAAGLTSIRQLDTQRFRISFVLHALAAFSILANLFDATVGVIARNPLAVAAGIVTREEYFEKYQPAYYSAIQMIAHTPVDARLYSLFEPRSYGASRDLRPDTILDHFPHDVFLYKNAEGILQSWHTQGYTHILLNIRGADFIYRDSEEKILLDQTLAMLEYVEVSPEGEYAIYKIPDP